MYVLRTVYDKEMYEALRVKMPADKWSLFEPAVKYLKYLRELNNIGIDDLNHILYHLDPKSGMHVEFPIQNLVYTELVAGTLDESLFPINEFGIHLVPESELLACEMAIKAMIIKNRAGEA